MSTVNPRIVVVGSINADLIARVAVQPRPGETVPGSDLSTMPGGKGGNQAVAAALLASDPGEVAMVGVIGDDALASDAISGLTRAGVNLDHVRRVSGQTGTALIAVADDSQNSIIVIPGANAAMTPGFVAESRGIIEAAEVVMLQCEIPAETVASVVNAAHGRIVLNFAPVAEVPAETLLAADPLVVNEFEAHGALACLGIELSQAIDVDAVTRVLAASGVKSAVVTLGDVGAVVIENGELTSIDAPTVQATDTKGAGDAFVGALALRLADGDSLLDAARFASRVAAYSVQGAGAQPSYPSRDDPLPELAEPAADAGLGE